MKITIVLGAFFPVPPIMGGAVEKIWFMLTQEFARRGHEVVVISRAMPQFPRQEILAGVKHFRVRGFNAPRSLIWLKLLDLIYSIRTMSVLPKVDIIVTNTFWLPLLLRNSKRGQIYVHATRYPKGQMRFYKKAARLQAPSHAVARAIAAEAPALAKNIGDSKSGARIGKRDSISSARSARENSPLCRSRSSGKRGSSLG